MKVLKTMISDITPKSWKSIKDGLILSLILLAIFSVVMIGISFFSTIIALVFNVSADAAVLLVFLILGLIAWICDAYERS